MAFTPNSRIFWLNTFLSYNTAIQVQADSKYSGKMIQKSNPVFT